MLYFVRMVVLVKAELTTNMSGSDHDLQLAQETRLQFEKLLADVSARFVRVAPAEVDREIEQALEQVRLFFNVDRRGVLRISPDKQQVRLTYAKGNHGNQCRTTEY